MAEYKNAVRSKKMLKQAFIDLISSKRDYNDITVSELVAKADVNRGTFYNHYNNIMDIVDEIKDELLDKMLSNIDISLKMNNTVENLFDVMTDFLKENEDVYKKLAPIVPKQIYDGLKSQAIRYLNTVALAQPRLKKFTIQYLANSIAGTYIDYFENRFDVTLDELKESSIRITNMFLTNCKE